MRWRSGNADQSRVPCCGSAKMHKCHSADGSRAVLIDDAEVSDLLSEGSKWDRGATMQSPDQDFLLRVSELEKGSAYST